MLTTLIIQILGSVNSSILSNLGIIEIDQILCDLLDYPTIGKRVLDYRYYGISDSRCPSKITDLVLLGQSEELGKIFIGERLI